MKQLFRHILSFAAAALLCTACSDDNGINAPIEEPLPEGCGRLRLNVTTAETATTRATTGIWLEGTSEERAIKNYHILMCDTMTEAGVTYIVDDIAGGDLGLSETHDDANKYYLSEFTAQSKGILGGTYTYTFYALVNFTPDMLTQAGLTLTDGKITDSTLPANFETKAIRLANSSSIAGIGGQDGFIPMTGKLTQTVTIRDGITTEVAEPLILWRMIAKLEFQFRNETKAPVRILGIEVDPINQASAGKGVFLISRDTLGSTYNDTASTGTARVPDKTDVGILLHTFTAPATSLFELAAKPTEGETPSETLTLYVNETDASATVTKNEYSVRIKTQRAMNDNPAEDEWFDSEIRYGFTQSYTGPAANPNANGFNVIRRNDWIKIPVTFSDWRLRLEVMDFVPIGGYPAAELDYLDVLNAVFRTGGWIVIKPVIEKLIPEAPGTEAYGLTSSVIQTTENQKVTEAGLSTWMEYDGVNIFDTAPSLQSDGTIIAELSNDAGKKGRATVTLTLKLEDFTYQFKFNITNK